MSRYDLFQPALSRLPVAVEHATRLDPARMSFPVAEDAGLRRTVYLDENVFRAGRRGSRTRSRPWPRSSGTPASFARAGTRGRPVSRRRTSAGTAGWPGAARPAGGGHPVLADQGVGEQRLEGDGPVAGHRRLDGQALVRLGLLHQAEELGGERVEGQRGRRRRRCGPGPRPRRRRAGRAGPRRCGRRPPARRRCRRGGRRSGRPRPRCRRPRRAAPAARAWCRARGRGTARAGPARSRPPARRARLRRCSSSTSAVA